ncbi:hypothetical protein ABT160_38220 [Streptomyces sp. NPDC001941]|uniref:hypothetical protein n=1 Tax=Streptomyces sp. NPDC001941 TaxID=3154659 RepID=UPI00331B76B1
MTAPGDGAVYGGGRCVPEVQLAQGRDHGPDVVGGGRQVGLAFLRYGQSCPYRPSGGFVRGEFLGERGAYVAGWM